MNVDFIFKLCLIGDGAVGKTSLRRRFLGEGFTKKHIATLGADFAVKTISITCPDNKRYRIKFQIWDLAGQQRFNMVRGQYYLGANGIIAVFDVTRPETLENLPHWFKEVKKHLTQDPIYVIVGNKIDLRTKKSKKKQEFVESIRGQEFATTNAKSITSKPVFYMETSAKTGENVEEAFKQLATELLRERGECT